MWPQEVTFELGLKDQGMLAPGRGAERWEQQQESERNSLCEPSSCQNDMEPRGRLWAAQTHPAGNTMSPAALQKSPGPPGGSLHLGLGPIQECLRRTMPSAWTTFLGGTSQQDP